MDYRTMQRILALMGVLGLGSPGVADAAELVLPAPNLQQRAALSDALLQRRSVRKLAPTPLSLETVAQLLWAAQGISSPDGLRTAPSAGALYPLELHLVAGAVEGLADGSYRYDPGRHSLTLTREGDLRQALAAAALGQNWIADAPILVVIAAVPERTTRKYGERGTRYVQMEAGHAGQNLLLQAVGLGLRAVVVGAFRDQTVQRLLGLASNEQPLEIVPVGYPR
jgi:SagB-type dehydrogenase family enzyme